MLLGSQYVTAFGFSNIASLLARKMLKNCIHPKNYVTNVIPQKASASQTHDRAMILAC
jgi:hypothetical protein